ncbi:hypothetical protein ALC53_09160 [Atta colombica]|uniref:Uncharacterized protein n=1 Tax=Atta colombica TaxID=520822 RepID=A0A151I1G8_9HYME|nr:hypothetical protein ALC53_09160 [Atta colombica]
MPIRRIGGTVYVASVTPLQRERRLSTTTERFIFENSNEQRNVQNYVLFKNVLSASPSILHYDLNAAGKLCSMQRSSAHTYFVLAVWQAAHKSDCLIVFSAAKKQGRLQHGKVAGTDKRLVRSRRHHPSIAFTLRAIPRRFAQLIGIAKSAGFCLAILSAVVSCKKENIRNRALQFRHEMNALYRLNYKINSLPYTTIFAQAAGFKVTWELPTTGELRNVRSVPDVHKCAELVYESNDREETGNTVAECRRSWFRWPFLLTKEYLPEPTIREVEGWCYREDIEIACGVSTEILISVTY